MTYAYKQYRGYAETNPERMVTVEVINGEREAVLKVRAILVRLHILRHGTDKKLIKVEEVR
jgi:hypothetical protein